MAAFPTIIMQGNFLQTSILFHAASFSAISPLMVYGV